MKTRSLKYPNILVAIINHNENQNAIGLKKSFAPLIDTVLIDSGSSIEEGHRQYFDYLLPNVYYNGLLNKAYECLKQDHSHLFLITSDVTISNSKDLLDRIDEVYSIYPEVCVYSPSAIHSTHYHQNNLGTGNIRKVTFTEGFCYVIPRAFLDETCPIDLSINKIGHGVDMYMGYLCMINNKWAVVDDKITVDHPQGSGYSDKQARLERDNWFATQDRKVRKYHYWISKDILKNGFGYWLIKKIMKL